jgi:hypothetical protein
MTPNEIRTVTVPVGSLASRVFRAERELLSAEKQIEDMLRSLFGNDWGDYDYGLGTLDVYDVIDSRAAVFALMRAGFRVVVLHDHPKKKFVQCACLHQRDHL